MSFLTAASDRSSSGSGVSGVSGASFSGVSGFTSSFSFTTVLVLVAIQYLLTSPSGETRTPTSGSPYPMGRVHDPIGLSPPPYLYTTALAGDPRACVSHMSTCQDGQRPTPGTALKHSKQVAFP